MFVIFNGENEKNVCNHFCPSDAWIETLQHFIVNKSGSFQFSNFIRIQKKIYIFNKSTCSRIGSTFCRILFDSASLFFGQSAGIGLKNSVCLLTLVTIYRIQIKVPIRMSNLSTT